MFLKELIWLSTELNPEEGNITEIKEKANEKEYFMKKIIILFGIFMKERENI
jgi:hypothetical protein